MATSPSFSCELKFGTENLRGILTAIILASKIYGKYKAEFYPNDLFVNS